MVRNNVRSHIGQQIERHLRRIGCDCERRIEVDGSDALVAMVAAGVGRAIATPLCLLQGGASAAGVLEVALPRAEFGRTLTLLCCHDGPAALAARAAATAATVLRDDCLPRLRALAPDLVQVNTLPDQLPGASNQVPS